MAYAAGERQWPRSLRNVGDDWGALTIVEPPILPPIDHLALVVDSDQVLVADQAEVHAERVDPETRGVNRVADGDVARNALCEAELREDAERNGQAVLEVCPLFIFVGECGRRCRLVLDEG